MDYTISRALPVDALQLKVIAVAAKAHWGYPAEWLARWATLFQVTEESLTHQQAYKAIANEAILGWHAVIVGQPVAVLDDLWVAPAFMGQGWAAPFLNTPGTWPSNTAQHAWQSKLTPMPLAFISTWAPPSLVKFNRQWDVRYR